MQPQEQAQAEEGGVTPELREAYKRAIDAKVREREGVGVKGFKCRSCGCDYDSHTKGCRTCTSRRANRLRHGYAMVRRCVGCSGHLDEQTPGCQTCRERHKKKRLGRAWEKDRLYSQARRARLRAA